MDISELTKEAKKGSAAAQKCLFDLLADKMMLVCRRYVKSHEDAEEIVLDGFFKFFKNLSSFNYQGEGSVYAWLKKIMVNECLMFLRRKHSFIITTEQEPGEIPLHDDALNNMSASEILKMILDLPVGYRTVFNLYVIEGMTHKEIGQLLNIAEGTSKSQLNKAKLLLQKNLVQKGNDYARQHSKYLENIIG
jgi:RNA polymerase sigma factor (sigma-70 family)